MPTNAEIGKALAKKYSAETIVKAAIISHARTLISAGAPASFAFGYAQRSLENELKQNGYALAVMGDDEAIK